MFAVHCTDFAVDGNKKAVTRLNYMLTSEELTEKYGEGCLAAQALAGNLRKTDETTARKWRRRRTLGCGDRMDGVKLPLRRVFLTSLWVHAIGA